MNEKSLELSSEHLVSSIFMICESSWWHHISYALVVIRPFPFPFPLPIVLWWMSKSRMLISIIPVSFLFFESLFMSSSVRYTWNKVSVSFSLAVRCNVRIGLIYLNHPILSSWRVLVDDSFVSVFELAYS